MLARQLHLTRDLFSAASEAGPEAEAESMWQHAGALALQRAAEWAAELLAAVTDCRTASLTGAGRIRPSHKYLRADTDNESIS